MATNIDLRHRDPEAIAEEHSIGELVSELTSDLSLLFRKEIELAKAEVRQEVSTAIQGGALFGAAGAIGFVALIVLACAGAWGIATVLSTPLAFLAMGGFLAVVAGSCAVGGKKRISAVSPVPDQTVESIKEDVEWAKAQIS